MLGKIRKRAQIKGEVLKIMSRGEVLASPARGAVPKEGETVASLHPNAYIVQKGTGLRSVKK